MKAKHITALLILLLLLPLLAIAQADEAKDITNACKITKDGKSYSSTKLRDRKYTTYCYLNRSHGLVIDGKGQELSGLYLQYYDRATSVEIQVEGEAGWETIASGGTYLTEWFPLPEGTTKARILNTDKNRLYLAELTVYGVGEKPASVPVWHTL